MTAKRPPHRPTPRTLWLVLALVALLLPAFGLQAQEYTEDFGRERCDFTSAGSTPYFPLWPGYETLLEGTEIDDEMEEVDVSVRITVTGETEQVDGVTTRVVQEYETEDGELIEISRNFFAVCRQTGDLWYFGEDVDIYEDGEIINHEGEWRAGQNGARPGIVMPWTPLLGARHYQELAPGVALDKAEIVSIDETITVPAGTFDDVVYIEEGSDVDPSALSEKWYAPGVGLIKDGDAELVELTPPPCMPDEHTLCLQDGRFRVEVDFDAGNGNAGQGMALLPSADSGEFFFFRPDNTELIVKVLDACSDARFNSFWVFAAGLTNVEVDLVVTDTQSGQMRSYENPLGTPFAPILDTQAFATCP